MKLEPYRRAYIENLFIALEMTDFLMEPSEENFEKPVLMAELYNYATQPDFSNSERVSRALENDSRLRSDFQSILSRISLVTMPHLVAASTEGTKERHAKGCNIRIAPDPARPDETYVIIEFSQQPKVNPGVLFVGREGEAHVRHSLPRVHNGIIQLLMKSDSELVVALQDIDSEVWFT
jgi:hypothetical protein